MSGDDIDIVRRIRLGDNSLTATEVIAEIERLRAWKADATAVIEQWETVFDMVTSHSTILGRSKAAIVADEIERLRGEMERLQAASIWRRTTRGERRVVTVHLPMPLDKVGRLGELLDELWPGCRMIDAYGDLVVITDVTVDRETSNG